MSQPEIRFEDGAAYERGMGGWTVLAGDVFLDWLAPPPGLRWLDIGCGNGAFTERLVRRCAPAEVQAIDPAPAQLSFARTRPGTREVQYAPGDAMALPFAADRFDAAVMALVIFFVPEPERGVAEMVRVVRPGGLVAAYAWDILGGGFPMEAINAELRAAGLQPVLPPSAAASRLDALRELWTRSGLAEVDTTVIEVTREFPDFAAFWASSVGTGAIKAKLAQLPPEQQEAVTANVAQRLGAHAQQPVRVRARANAVRGRRPPVSPG